MSRYTPYFSAKHAAADRWNLASEPSPRHERLISTLRRVETISQSQREARESSQRVQDQIDSRDWNKWRRLAYAEGIDITNG